ncbi:MAG: trypsin-like peptidase domain-containing protein [Lentisphaerota bacterium]
MMKARFLIKWFVVFGGWLAAGLAFCAQGEAGRRTPIVLAVEKAMPSVVNLSTVHRVNIRYTESGRQFRGSFFDRLLDSISTTAPSNAVSANHLLGSGVIILPEGYILTNFHVTERADRIKVLLNSGVTVDAVFVAGDEASDLALIRIQSPEPLAAMQFELNDHLMLGETVIAMGNPFGLSQTVTAGILSSTNREARYEGRLLYSDILQTDAAINPGSSGGPLLDINGKLIGIHVAVYEGGQNIGFAVPARRVRELLSRWLDPRLLQNMALGFEAGMSNGVLVVSQVEPGSSAQMEGVEPGELIRSVHGRAVGSVFDFYQALLGVKAGDTIPIVLNKDAQDRTVQITAASLSNALGERLAAAKLGLMLAETGSGTGYEVQVAGIQPGGAAIAKGSILTRINDTDINSLEDVGVILEKVAAGEPVEVAILEFSGEGPDLSAVHSIVTIRAK